MAKEAKKQDPQQQLEALFNKPPFTPEELKALMDANKSN